MSVTASTAPRSPTSPATSAAVRLRARLNYVCLCLSRCHACERAHIHSPHTLTQSRVRIDRMHVRVGGAPQGLEPAPFGGAGGRGDRVGDCGRPGHCLRLTGRAAVAVAHLLCLPPRRGCLGQLRPLRVRPWMDQYGACLLVFSWAAGVGLSGCVALCTRSRKVAWGTKACKGRLFSINQSINQSIADRVPLPPPFLLSPALVCCNPWRQWFVSSPRCSFWRA